MSTYGYYYVLSWCVAFLPGGVGFFLFIGIVTACVALPWQCLKKNAKEDDESFLKSLNTDSSLVIESGGKDDSKDDQNKLTCKCRCCCYTCTCELWKLMLQGILQLTERASHYFFETDSLNIIRDDKHGRVLVISGRKFKLTFKALWCIIIYNCVVIGIISSVAMNYLVIHETLECNEKLDCFLERGTNYSSQPIENCTKYATTNDAIRCYSINLRPAVVLALVGGFLKIVPPLVFYVTTTLFLILLKNVHWGWKLFCNITLAVLFIIALIVVSIITGLKLISFIYESEERAAQMFVFIFLCIVFACWPWYVLNDVEKPSKDKEMESKDRQLEDRQSEDRQSEDRQSEDRQSEDKDNPLALEQIAQL